MLRSSKPVIAITIGDFNGIGPEIILKTLLGINLTESTPVIVSPPKIIEQAQKYLGSKVNLHHILKPGQIETGTVNLLEIPSGEVVLTPGNQTKASGSTAMKSIETCIKLCKNESVHAMVTAPISKEAVNLAGYAIPGHTEFLASKTNTPNFLMMLVSGGLRVSLVTTHIPVSEVSSSISKETIRAKIEILSKSLRQDFGINNPKIAVFGLNPHAGDGGVIGTEEIEIIDPLLKEIRNEDPDFTLDGPFPADGFFGQKLYEKYDAILAMYHDQGLAPFKLISFGKGVNFTAGLPIIRTSPDHGTAFDIAGKGVANPSSFTEAYNLAVELANKRIREQN
jgi:4-hydroxythreonine-4-phosphate dehydrogenase